MGNPFVQQQPDMKELYQQFIQNPTKYLTGLNIPANLTTPQQMVEYCLNNNKINIPPMLRGQISAMFGKK